MTHRRKDIEAFRNRARHFRSVAERVWDENSRASLLSVAADYEERARKLEETGDTDEKCAERKAT
jgi:hypothetical protein